MTKDLNNKLPIPEDVKKLKKIFEERVGLGVSFDLGVRSIKVLKNISNYIMLMVSQIQSLSLKF